MFSLIDWTIILLKNLFLFITTRTHFIYLTWNLNLSYLRGLYWLNLRHLYCFYLFLDCCVRLYLLYCLSLHHWSCQNWSRLGCSSDYVGCCDGLSECFLCWCRINGRCSRSWCIRYTKGSSRNSSTSDSIIKSVDSVESTNWSGSNIRCGGNSVSGRRDRDCSIGSERISE